MYLTYFIVLYYDQQMHNYSTNSDTPTCFVTIVYPQGACNLYLAKLHKYLICSCW